MQFCAIPYRFYAMSGRSAILCLYLFTLMSNSSLGRRMMIKWYLCHTKFNAQLDYKVLTIRRRKAYMINALETYIFIDTIRKACSRRYSLTFGYNSIYLYILEAETRVGDSHVRWTNNSSSYPWCGLRSN